MILWKTNSELTNICNERQSFRASENFQSTPLTRHRKAFSHTHTHTLEHLLKRHFLLILRIIFTCQTEGTSWQQSGWNWAFFKVFTNQGCCVWWNIPALYKPYSLSEPLLGYEFNHSSIQHHGYPCIWLVYIIYLFIHSDQTKSYLGNCQLQVFNVVWVTSS